MKAIILAGGLGKRMSSDIPKVLHKVGDESMINRIINALARSNIHNILIVVGIHEDLIAKDISNTRSNITFIKQPVPLGTGNAVLYCLPYLSKNEDVIIINGDMPLIDETILLPFSEIHGNALITMNMENPHGYGRIIKKISNGDGDGNGGGKICIVEEKDCTPDEKMCKIVNAGLYKINSNDLEFQIPLLKENPITKEYYLTDVIGNLSFIIEYFVKDNDKLLGVNTFEELSVINKKIL